MKYLLTHYDIKVIKRKPLTNELKKHISDAKKGKKRIPFTEEWKRKLSESHKAKWDREKRTQLIPSFGMQNKKHSEETKRKISIKLLGRNKGVKSSLWKGGYSALRMGYSLDWTETLRRSIRERDKYVCRVCGRQQGEKVFAVHHIDGDKQNCNPMNLITLCRSCHSKTNHGSIYWRNYLTNIVK